MWQSNFKTNSEKCLCRENGVFKNVIFFIVPCFSVPTMAPWKEKKIRMRLHVFLCEKISTHIKLTQKYCMANRQTGTIFRTNF